LHVPLFETFHVFVKLSPGLNTVPAGIVSSRSNSRLLQPYARVEGLGVAVYCVPVGVIVRVAVTILEKKINVAVGELIGEGWTNGVSVASGEGVMVGVSVAGGTKAVWVRKTDSATVPTAAVRMALRSGVGDTSLCPPQDASKIPNKASNIMKCRNGTIFTSF
jgi:hypothetical protein